MVTTHFPREACEKGQMFRFALVVLAALWSVGCSPAEASCRVDADCGGKGWVCREAARFNQGKLLCTHPCATQDDCHDFPDCYVCLKSGNGGTELLCQKDIGYCVTP